MKKYLPIVSVVVGSLLLGFVQEGSAQVPTREIINVRGDLYRAQNNNHFTVFLVTPDGIILTDPIERSFAEWLKTELDRRFNLPVRYVLYTHHHWDHASGGEVFAETAEFVAHRYMLNELALLGGESLPDELKDLDVDGNGAIDVNEAEGTLQTQFDLHDADGNGLLSGAEIERGPVRDVFPPTITFTSRHAVTLGGKTVWMVPTGDAHSKDMVAILFTDEGVLFGTDLLQIRRLPIGVDPNVGAWIDAFQLMASLEFEIVVPGHGQMGTKEDIVAFQSYLSELAVGVASGVGRNQPLEQIQRELRPLTYSGWERYETMLPVHIQEIYTTLTGNR